MVLTTREYLIQTFQEYGAIIIIALLILAYFTWKHFKKKKERTKIKKELEQTQSDPPEMSLYDEGLLGGTEKLLAENKDEEKMLVQLNERYKDITIKKELLKEQLTQLESMEQKIKTKYEQLYQQYRKTRT